MFGSFDMYFIRPRVCSLLALLASLNICYDQYSKDEVQQVTADNVFK